MVQGRPVPRRQENARCRAARKTGGRNAGRFPIL
jgi:hypothetical protein